MTQRTMHSSTNINSGAGLKANFRLSKLFQCHQHGHFDSSISISLKEMHLACQDNDLSGAESCLKKMKYEEINYQYPPNKETALHIATKNQHENMIELLLHHGAQRALKNIDGEQAHELALSQEIRDLFKRHKISRFIFNQSNAEIDTLFPRVIKCKSCSLINDNTYYEWELVDRSAVIKALKLRHELKPFRSMKNSGLKRKLYSIKKGYLTTRLKGIDTKDVKRIYDYFKRVLHESNPHYIITAYTVSQSFTKLLNKDMSRNVIHDLKNGCSKFSCDCLYSTEDGTKSITTILLYHPAFEEFKFQGKAYRGIILDRNALKHYKKKSCIIATTFVSVSTDPKVARMYCDKGTPDPTKHAFFCTYELVNGSDRTALDISKLSDYSHEDEVLILPYSAFLITNIEEGREITNIYLKEQCFKEIIGNDASQTHLTQSSIYPFENTNEILFGENDNITTSQSAALPIISTQF